MQIDEKLIANIVEQVIMNVQSRAQVSASASGNGDLGVFKEVDEALKAAGKAQAELAAMSLEKREELVRAMRQAGIDNARSMAVMAVEETRLGRVEDKVIKNINASKLTPGTEDLRPRVFTGDEGLTLVERAPFGVIAAICPTTHPCSLVINNAIVYVASGNAAFFCPHPRSQRTSLKTIQFLNDAIINAGGPANLLVGVDKATLDVVDTVIKHPIIKLVVASGGPAVVKSALTSGKPAVAAGPGNPPALVDETADIKKAARDIIEGHSFDNNILCIAEKSVIVVEGVADDLVKAFKDNRGYVLKGNEVQKMTELCVKDGHVNGECVGQDARVLLERIGITGVGDVRTVIIEVEADHPLVRLEQMMPVLPVVRVRNFDDGLTLAHKIEGCGHTAIIHSKDINRITRYAQVMSCTLLVANKPSGASLNVGGEGQFTHTIAGPTGQGVATPITFTRERRVILGNGLSLHTTV